MASLSGNVGQELPRLKHSGKGDATMSFAELRSSLGGSSQSNHATVLKLSPYGEKKILYNLPLKNSVWKFSFWLLSPVSYKYFVIYDNNVIEEKDIDSNPIPFLVTYSDIVKKDVGVKLKNISDFESIFYLSVGWKHIERKPIIWG